MTQTSFHRLNTQTRNTSVDTAQLCAPTPAGSRGRGTDADERDRRTDARRLAGCNGPV